MTPYTEIPATAGQTDFDVPFPYISRDHLVIRVNGEETQPLSWPNASRFRLAFGAAGGDLVSIERVTPIDDELVKFSDGNVLTADDLNKAVRQVLYRQQEISSAYDRSVNASLIRLASLGGSGEATGEDVLEDIVLGIAEDATVQSFQQRISEIEAVAAEVLTHASALIDQQGNISSLASRADEVETDLLTSKSALEAQTASIRADLTTLTGVVDALAGDDSGSGLATLIQDEENARIVGDQALVDTLSLIGAKSPDGTAFIADLASLKVSPTETLGERLTAISATAGANTASIAAEAQARADAVQSEASRIDLLTSRVGTAEADIVSEVSVRTSADEALAGDISVLTARVVSAEADIVTEKTVRADADGALAADVSGLLTRMGTAEASIVTEQQARSSADDALSSSLTALTVRMDDAEAGIISEQSSRVSADEALALDLSALTARVGTAEAAIVTEQQARADGFASVASSLSVLTTRMGDAEAGIANEQSVRTDEVQALATDINALTVQIGQAEASIVSEQQARADADSAITSDLTALLSRMGDAEAAIVEVSNAEAYDDSALVQSISSLSAKVDDNEASIATEQQARADADSALSTYIGIVETELDGNKATVTTLQSSIDGLEAKYGVALDVNGYVTGFAQNNDGVTGEFVIRADRFAIIDPTPGSTPVVPFEVNDGKVFIKNAVIENLGVDRLGDGTLGANVTLDGNLSVGSGKVIWDNGVFMKVAGVGFGTTGQFIEWFGPRMDLDQCSEANAITYLKTDGSAYFGGSLSAGTLRNAVQTTQTSADASVSTGTFGSNGGTRTVTLSFSSVRSVPISGACDGTGTPNVTVELYRNGSYIQTLTLSGTTSCDRGFGPSEPGNWSENMSGSLTFTDTSGGLSAEYTATIISRSLSTPPSSTLGQVSHTQRVSVVSVEE